MFTEAITLYRTRGALSQELQYWGIRAAKFTHGSLSTTSKVADEFSISICMKVTDAMPFVFGDRIELVNSAGTRFFVGFANEPKPVCTAGEQRVDVTFMSPDWWLQGTYVINVNRLRSDNTYEQKQSGEIVLMRTIGLDGSGNPISTPTTLRAQIQQVITFAQEKGNAGGAAAFTVASDGIAAIPDVYAEERTMRRAPTGQVIDSLLDGIAPHVARRWNYAGAIGDAPVMEFVAVNSIGTDESGGSILVDPPTLSGAGSLATHEIPNDGTVFDTEGFSMEPANVLIHSYQLAMQSQSTDTVPRILVPGSPASVIENGSPIDWVEPVTLRGPLWDGKNGTYTAPEAVPTPPTSGLSLTQLAHQPYARRWWNVRANLRQQSLRWDLWPANMVRITNGGDAAAKWTVIQSITRDFATNKVSITSGNARPRGMLDKIVGIGISRPNVTGNKEPRDNGGGAQYGKKDGGAQHPPGTGPAGTPATCDCDPEVTALAYGASPTVENEGTTTNAFFKFSLPPGAPGTTQTFDSSVDVGTTGGASSGSLTNTMANVWKLALALNIPGITSVTAEVSTLPAGSDATVTVTFTDGVLAFVFGIPKGDKGDKGDPGDLTAGDLAAFKTAMLAANPTLNPW